MKILLAAVISSCILTPAFAGEERSPIVWNAMENEVAVIKGGSERFGPNYVVIQPTQKFLDLGRYEVVIPAAALQPRARGGWYSAVSNDDIPYLLPEVPQYFQPSGK
ncbi:MAG: hypothetical protein H0U98_16555 [Alphaproteobacteria bacterium]|nr:hypothetical protein [Alphaproteobacteria bacterium]